MEFVFESLTLFSRDIKSKRIRKYLLWFQAILRKRMAKTREINLPSQDVMDCLSSEILT